MGYNDIVAKRLTALNDNPGILEPHVSTILAEKYGWNVKGTCFVTNTQLICDSINTGSDPAEEGTRRPLLTKRIGRNYVMEFSGQIEIIEPFDWWGDDQTYELNTREAMAAMKALKQIEKALASGR